MTNLEKPYGNINIFPAISPIMVMIIAYVVEALYGQKVSESAHEGIVAVATVFTYGLILLPLISYFAFKYIVLPTLNSMPTKTKINSYFLNSIIMLVLVEIVLLLISGGRSWHFASAVTAFIAFNCFGHICMFNFLKWVNKYA